MRPFSGELPNYILNFTFFWAFEWTPEQRKESQYLEYTFKRVKHIAKNTPENTNTDIDIELHFFLIS